MSAKLLWKLFSAAMVMVLLAAGLTPAAAQEGGFTLSGTLTGADGEPLAGAVVQLEGAGQAVSGPDGAYSFSGLAPGEYVLTAAYEGLILVPFYRVVQVEDANVSELDFRPQSEADTKTPASLPAPVILGAPPLEPAVQAGAARPAESGIQAGDPAAGYGLVGPDDFNPTGYPTFRYDRTIGVSGEPYLPDPDGKYLNDPSGVTFDNNGRVLVADSQDNRIKAYLPPDPAAVQMFGSLFENGEQMLDNPRRVSEDYDTRNLWVLNGGLIKLLDSSGTLLMNFPAWNTCTSSADFDCTFYDPWGITYMRDAGTVAVTDRANGKLYIFEVVANPAFDPGQPPDPWYNPAQTLSLKYVQSGLSAPTDVAYDWWNNYLYVAETGANRVLRCPGSSTAMCVVFTTSGGPGPLSLNEPYGLDVLANDELYIADTGNHRILRCDLNDVFSLPVVCTHYLGQAGMGHWTNAYFNWPMDVAAGSLIAVADTGNNRVQVFMSGSWYARLGTTGAPYLTDSQHIFRPVGVDYWGGMTAVDERDRVVVRDASTDDVIGVIHQSCVYGRPSLGPGPSDGLVYLAVPCQGQVMIYTVHGEYVDSIFGRGSNNSLSFGWIVGTELITSGPNAGVLLVVDEGLSEIHIFSPSRVWQATLGSMPGSGLGQFAAPQDVALSPDQQKLAVADYGNNRISIWKRSGSIYSWGPGTEAEFIAQYVDQPTSLQFDETGLLYITEEPLNGADVYQWDAGDLEWDIENMIGGRRDMTTGGMRIPRGIALNTDDLSQIYIADRENHRVQVFRRGVPGWDMLTSLVMAGWSGISTVESWNGLLLAGSRALVGGDFGQVYLSGDDGAEWFGPVAEACPDGSDPGCPDANWTTSDMQALGDKLYISFPRSIWRIGSTPSSDENVSIAGLPDGQMVWHLGAFKGKLYSNTIKPGGGGAQIWRTDGLGSPPAWTMVKEFADPGTGFHGVAPFAEKGLVLYAATSDAQVWYSSDGALWAQVPGLDLGGGAGSFSLFGGALYLAVDTPSELIVYRCASTANCKTKAGWVKLSLPAELRRLHGMGAQASIVLGNRLYLAATDNHNGLQIWRTSGSGWEKFLRDDGFGSSVNQIAWSNASLAVHKGQLVAGTVNEDQGIAGAVWMTSADWRAPEDGEQLLNLKPTFQWGLTPGAGSYQIQIAAFSGLTCNFAAPIISATATSTTYIPSGSLPAGKHLCWHARAKVGASYKPWLETLSFYTPNPPSVPSLVWPLSGALVADPTVAFDWKNSVIPESTVFDRYEIQVAFDSEFSKIAADIDTKISTIPILLERNKQFYWRVRAFNNSGEYSLWSSARILKIAPALPVLLAPTLGATGVPRKPTLDWAPVDGAASYTITASTYSTFAYPLLSKTVTADEFAFITTLPANKKIYWRVRANGPVGSSAYVKSFFTTGP